MRRNERDVAFAVMEILSDLRLALCLLNQRWTANGYNSYQGFVDMFNFPKLPGGYREIVPILWLHRIWMTSCEWQRSW